MTSALFHLTAVVQPAFEMGATATRMLIELIESKRPVTDFHTITLDTTLVINDSSKRNLKSEKLN